MNAVGRLPKLELHLWLAIIGTLAAPFYVLPSGNPQPADLLFVLFGVAFVLREGGRFRYPRDAGTFMAFAGAFWAWVALVNTWWTGWTGSLQITKSTVFYTYNCGVMAVYVLAYQRYGRAWLVGTVWACAASILGQVLLSPLKMRWGAVRQELFYNNPNQLAYFALLMGVIVFAGSQRLKIPTWLQVAVYLAAAFLVLLSASRAALLSMFALVGLLAVRRPVVLLVLGLLAVAGAVAAGLEPASIFGRLLDAEQGTNRGYFRLFKYPQYLILGAGEGYIHRFAVIDHWAYELHSNFATLLFCYGIVGTVLFGLFHWQIIRRGGFLSALALMPPYVFGLTHQGLRFTQLWILLGFLMCLAIESRRQEALEASGVMEPEPVRRAV